MIAEYAAIAAYVVYGVAMFVFCAYIVLIASGVLFAPGALVLKMTTFLVFGAGAVCGVIVSVFMFVFYVALRFGIIG